jgi:hypothetical protein
MIALVLSLVLSQPAAPPAAAVKAEMKVEPEGFKSHVDPERVQLGEPFIYELVVTHPKNVRYELRTGPDLGAFEVLDQKRSRVDGRDTATTTFKLQMSAFELGKLNTPDFTFDVIGEEGAGHWVAPGREVEIVSALPKDADEKGANLFDIRPPEDVPVRTWRLLYALGALLLTAAAAYGIYRLIKRARTAPAIPAAPPKPAHVRATAALDALRAADLPAQGLYKEFYFRLSLILRSYLGEIYAFEASESTTYELLESLRRLHTPGLPFERFSGFCSEADMVKFAKASVGPDACKAAIEFGYHVIGATHAPQPLPLAPSGNATQPHVP